VIDDAPVGKRPYAPRMRSDERREQLLDAALDLINIGGITAVSVDAVAKAVGVTRPVVYSVFDDANHILRALLEREGTRALAQLTALLPSDLSTADPVETFTVVARSFFAAVQATPRRWRSILLPVDASPPPVRSYKERAANLLRDRFAEITRTFLADCEGAEDVDVELLAHLLLSALETAGRLVLADPEGFPAERLTAMARFLAETLMHRYPPNAARRATVAGPVPGASTSSASAS
jgi:AcrR family transcriptional regulator